MKKSATNFENLNLNQQINGIDTQFMPVTFDIHWHHYVEIIGLPVSAKAHAIININQVDFTLTPGDVIIIWPGELHEIKDNTSKELIGLQFPPSIFYEIPDFASHISLYRKFQYISPQTYPELAESIHAYLAQILELKRKSRPFFNVETLITLYSLFVDFGIFVRNTLRLENEDSDTNSTIDKINSVCRYIADNCTKSLSLDDVADYVNFSPWYFSRIFRKATNFTFIEYLNQQRIHFAQNLLTDSDASITEISYQSGFRSISTFNRVFRQVKGCSPRDYRKYYMNE